jgi:DNA polymerase-3 subunit epsilon
MTQNDRIICLDTETTGIKVEEGHRIIEIGCVEMKNFIKTSKTFQVYINPEREIDAAAIRVHGISNDMLKDKPKFRSVAKDFLDFIGDSCLVIHNAAFDIKFLNHELSLLKIDPIKNAVVDTIDIIKSKYPGSPLNLDFWCKKFNISLENRNFHGALIDSDLLASLYIELNGVNKTISLDDIYESSEIKQSTERQRTRNNMSFVVLKPSSDEINSHAQIMKEIRPT